VSNKVSVRIGSEFDKRGTEEARGALAKLKNSTRQVEEQGKVSTEVLSASWLKVTAVVFGVIKAFQAVKGMVDDLVGSFAKQEAAEIRLAAAAMNNLKLTTSSLKNIKAYAAEMQKISIFGDEDIIQQQAFLATLSMTTDQINRVTYAAVNLASTGMMSLESAFKNVSKTYSGLTGELGEMIPQLKDFTQEELKAGKGVEFIISKYQGMAEAVAAGVGGAQAQFDNMLGDIKEQLGAALAPIKLQILNTIKPAFDQISSWISENQDKITNFFVHLPEIIGLTMQSAKNAIFNAFRFEHLIDYFKAILDYIKTAVVNTFKTIGIFIAAIGKTIFAPIQLGFENIVYGIKLAFRTVVDFLTDSINKLLSPVNVLLSGLGKIILYARQGVTAIGVLLNNLNPLNPRQDLETEVAKTTGVTVPELKIEGPTWDTLAKPQTIADMTKNIETIWKDALAGAVDNASEVKDKLFTIISTALEPYGEAGEDLRQKVSEILGRKVVTTSPVPGLEAQAGGNSVEAPEVQARTWSAMIQDIRTGIGDMMSWFGATSKSVSSFISDSVKSIGSGIKTFLDNPIETLKAGVASLYFSAKDAATSLVTLASSAAGAALSFITSGIGQLTNQFISLVTSTQEFQAVMSGINTIMQAAVSEVVQPLFEALKPIIDILISLFATVAHMLVPVIQMIGLLIQSTLPFWSSLAAIIIAVITVLQALMPPVMMIIGIIAQVLSPIIQIVASLFSAFGSVLEILTPLFDALGIAIKVLMTPIVTVAAIFQWVAVVIENFGIFVSNMVNDFWSFDWGSGMKSANLGDMIASAVKGVWSAPSAGDYSSLIPDTGIPVIPDGFSGTSNAVYGGNTSVQRVPDIYNYNYFNAPIFGDGGKAEAGRFIVEAIQEFIGTGGKVEFLEVPG